MTERPYHHGDLRATLLDAGVELARHGGPAAVGLREAARRAGVSHNAGYRHFADREAYLDAVAERGMGALAEAMEAALADVPAGLDAPERARRRLSAIGASYVRFARDEPGLFRTAFATRESPETASGAAPDGRDPYELLVRTLDELVAAGVLPADRREHSEIVAWSSVHGLSSLLLDGPLRGSSDADIEAMWSRVDAAVLRGL